MWIVLCFPLCFFFVFDLNLLRILNILYRFPQSVVVFFFSSLSLCISYEYVYLLFFFCFYILYSIYSAYSYLSNIAVVVLLFSCFVRMQQYIGVLLYWVTYDVLVHSTIQSNRIACQPCIRVECLIVLSTQRV